MGGAASHDIEDGILSLDDPNFEQKYLTLKRKEHTRFRIDHLSWWREELPSEEEYAEARRNLDAHAGRWTTSSLTAPPPALLSSSPGTMWRTT